MLKFLLSGLIICLIGIFLIPALIGSGYISMGLSAIGGSLVGHCIIVILFEKFIY